MKKRVKAWTVLHGSKPCEIAIVKKPRYWKNIIGRVVRCIIEYDDGMKAEKKAAKRGK